MFFFQSFYKYFIKANINYKTNIHSKTETKHIEKSIDENHTTVIPRLADIAMTRIKNVPGLSM